MLNDHQQKHRDMLASIAARRWGHDGELVHIADSGNSVWLMAGPAGRYILRLTNPAYRSAADCRAELDFLRHLDVCGVAVAAPLPSRAGLYVEEVEHDASVLASVFTFADGELVMRNSPMWGQSMLREWGATLGRIHRAAQTFAPGAERRWQWREEILIAQAPSLIPAADHEAHAALRRILAEVEALPRGDDAYGLTHADFAPQNFRYHPARGIVSFDFGNCCYHWFASDLAISLSTLRLAPDRDLWRSWLLEGYLAERPEARPELASIPLLMQLRAMYVYLSRLYKFGPQPTEAERDILRDLRDYALAPGGWPMPH